MIERRSASSSVAEHALAGGEIAIDQVGRRPVAELERERAARVERADVARAPRSVRGRRRAPPGRACRAPRRAARPRATRSRARRRPRRCSRARVVSSVSAARSPAVRCDVREHAERRRRGRARRAIAGARASSAPSMSPAASARSSWAARSRRSRRRVAAARRASAASSRLARSAGARRRGCLLEQLRGIGVTADRLVAARERQLRGGNRRIERERLLVVDLRLRLVVEPLLEDQRELEVQRAALARRRRRRRSRDTAATPRAPTRRAPSRRCAAGMRSPDRPGEQACASLRQRYASASRPSASR